MFSQMKRKVNPCMYDRHFLEIIYKLVLFMKPRIWVYLLGLTGNCISQAGFGIIVAFTLKDMFNAAVKGNTDLLVRAVISICAAIAVLSIVSTFSSYVFNKCVKQIITDIRLKVFKHTLKLPLSYCENHHSGDLMSRITNDIQGLEGVYSYSITPIIITLLRGVGCSAALIVLEWRIALVVIILGAVSALINTRFIKPLHNVSDIIQKQQSTIVSMFIDLLAGMRLIKIFNTDRMVVNQFDKSNNDTTTSMEKQARIVSLLAVTNAFLGRLSFICIIVFGVFLLRYDLMDFGTIIAMVELASGVNAMFLLLGDYIARLQTSLAGARRILELLEESPEPERFNVAGNCRVITANTTDSAVIEKSSAVIEMSNVDFSYKPNMKILDNVSISVRKDEFTALVGASGSGKSTIIKLLMGLYPCISGNIEINNKPIDEYDLTQLRDLISYVPQDTCLFSASIEDNISYGCPGASMEDIIEAARMANAHDFIMEQQKGYRTLIEEYGTNLSGGQKQRIAIARALLKDAPILLLDEPTSALDTGSEKMVQKTLNTLMRNRTVLVITHRLSTIRNAETIFVINDGIIVESGKHDELMALEGIYRRFYELQCVKKQ